MAIEDFLLRPGHRLYFAAVGILALWVGMWGYFAPPQVDRAIPWLVPPMHARFLGSMYLSGATFMLGCLLARRWSQVRAIVPVIAVWTGVLFVVSLFYLDQFDFSRTQVWIWFGAYLVYPLIALGLIWQHRGAREAFVEGAELRPWARKYLSLQGIVVAALAASLLFATAFMVTIWPWKVTPLLARLYSSPFLAYGIGSLLAARRRAWLEARIVVWGTFAFAALVLVASCLHRGLFDFSETADRVWFGGFGVATLLLAGTILSHARPAN